MTLVMDVSHTCGMTEWTWLALWFFLGRMSEEGWDGRLPAVKSLKTTATRIILYTVLLWGLTLAFAPVADMGAIYVVSALVVGAVFLALSIKVYRDPQPKLAMALFGWSITYVALLFGAMAVDVMVRNGI